LRARGFFHNEGAHLLTCESGETIEMSLPSIETPTSRSRVRDDERPRPARSATRRPDSLATITLRNREGPLRVFIFALVQREETMSCDTIKQAADKVGPMVKDVACELGQA